ncbi:K(+)-transporting ATPase subunit B [Fusobacterium ulcerans]|uniref:Potassium-transporting ATPase ATP-binding subunit n=1 Tax=Fusobacterium ulcerans TaxID=861 RepID=A0AAX2J6L3_9FUSO|nr:potassium-transporting ATPase subunit KdpB [Fusobacterium ulcerans]AVQ28124.1 K(+)-transporting ATPase subunit B [Fusobacterium ulcerans]EFS25587.2 potassium-transporting ATPase B chain [Fusobacterium ulcerans ATCC 49185]MEE0139202.1 potassium-transporting ATPase subunit KdpB [Fusobacterium ulcerans]SQI99818.1 Potassium-transporting ATPase B chain [Fusobacterium ulcerans]
MSKKQVKSISKEILNKAFIESFKKFDPRILIKNPVIFVVEIGFFLTLILTINPSLFTENEADLRIFNGIISFILFVTVIFANFAESIAEGRGKAQADSLKKTRKETSANLLKEDGSLVVIDAGSLKKGDIVIVNTGELIPNDGTVIEGIASVDESAITGESAPVIKEAGGDFSSVTGGTRVVSDKIKVQISVSSGESFLDKMINLVEGAERKKTPNEIALNTVLVGLTLIFLVVIVTLFPMGLYAGVHLPLSTLIALLVCLIPTTIGGLLSAIGIAGMDRVNKFNVIAMSGKAVETCGDINTIILDKTGTITFGNRLADDFFPVTGIPKDEMIKYSAISSLKDLTPEGRSIVELSKKLGIILAEKDFDKAEFIEFSAQTKTSGINLENGQKIRKGSGSSIKKFVHEQNGDIPKDLDNIIDRISRLGGTPLVLAVDNKIYGVIYLKDTVKPGLKERFDNIRKMGIKTIMCTGDNPLTAETIAKEAGIDEFVAECTPEEKIEVIKREQAQGKLVAMTGDGTNDAPALAQADVGIAMNSGTIAAKEAANMVDLDSNPTKILEVVEIGKQLLITRGALTTFSIANDVAKYFAIIPAMFIAAIPQMEKLNIMHLSSPMSAIISALIFNAVIIPLLVPIALKGVKYKPMNVQIMLLKNLGIYGVGGIIAPFIGIKFIDLIVTPFLSILGM